MIVCIRVLKLLWFSMVLFRIANDSLCLQCYQHMDPTRWQYEYKRVEAPRQYGDPPLATETQAGQQSADISQLLEALKLQVLPVLISLCRCFLRRCGGQENLCSSQIQAFHPSRRHVHCQETDLTSQVGKHFLV